MENNAVVEVTIGCWLQEIENGVDLQNSIADYIEDFSSLSSFPSSQYFFLSSLNEPKLYIFLICTGSCSFTNDLEDANAASAIESSKSSSIPVYSTFVFHFIQLECAYRKPLSAEIETVVAG